MTKKQVGLLIGLILIGILVWHFAIKDYNYRISFTTKDSPGLVYSNLNSWNFIKELPDSSEVSVIEKHPFKSITQQVKVNDSLFEYRWELEKWADSLTKVTVFVTDLNNQFKQNISSPFVKNDFVKRSILTVKDLGEEWVNYRDKFRIGEVTKANFAKQFCAYITVNSKVTEKAGTMIRNIADVMGFINTNNLDLQGDPFLQVTQWDTQAGTITYDFCFPIKREDTLSNSTLVKFKEVPEFSGIKTVFNGNYSISDKAWYTLLDYAQAHKINIDLLPVEIYRNDPHTGGNPLEWEAEVFMPIQN